MLQCSLGTVGYSTWSCERIYTLVHLSQLCICSVAVNADAFVIRRVTRHCGGKSPSTNAPDNMEELVLLLCGCHMALLRVQGRNLQTGQQTRHFPHVPECSQTKRHASCIRAHVCVCVCWCARARVCVRACVYVCVCGGGGCHIKEEGLHGSRGGRSTEGARAKKDV